MSRPKSRKTVPILLLSLICGFSGACAIDPHNPGDPSAEEHLAFNLTRCLVEGSRSCPILRNGITWSNILLAVNNGSQGLDDALNAGAPSVIRDGSLYKMWYGAQNAGSVNSIIYAESTDGIHWNSFQTVLTTGASGLPYDVNRVYEPCVRKVGSVYHIWYAGLAADSNVRTLHATSTDGITWTNFSLALNVGQIPGKDDRHAFAVRVLGNRIWYSAVDSSSEYRIATCTSSDDVTFNENCQVSIDHGHQGTLDLVATATGAFFQDRSVIKGWYRGASSGFQYDLIYCESRDGIAWTDCQVSIPRGSQGTYDTNSIGRVTVLEENGVGKIWFAASDGINTRILYAESH